MSNIKETLKNVGKHVWELFKASVPAGLMFLCASLVLLVLTLKGEKIEWNNPWAKSLSIAGSIGFYCWQTGKAEQNDAYMYGLRAEYEAKYLKILAEWGGYNGWQENGDCPMVIKARLSAPCGLGFEPYIAYQYGIRDWEYHEIRVGLKYSIDIIKQIFTIFATKKETQNIASLI